MIMTGCQSVSDEIDFDGAYKITSLEAEIEDGQTRTTVLQSGDVMKILWSAGDRIEVTDLTSAATFTLKEGAKTNRGTFSGSIVSKSKELYGIYPASSVDVSGSSVKVSIPAFQSYTKDADIDLGGKNLMYGHASDGHSFSFRPLAAVAKFNVFLNNSNVISAIVMRTENAYIAGSVPVDLTSGATGSFDSKQVSLTLADPAVGTVSGAWMLIAPTDFTKISGKVFYDVVTDQGTYTFCRRPTKSLEAGMAYSFPLSTLNFTKVASESDLAEGKYMFRSSALGLTVRTVHTSDSTITVEWSKTGFPKNYSEDIAEPCTVHLYDGSGQEVVSWAPNANTAQSSSSAAIYTYDASGTYPPRWCFSGLEPSTHYRVKVKETSSGTESNLLDVVTPPVNCQEVVSAARNEGDVVLFENFSKFIWNGDIVSLAAGYAYADYTSITDIDDGKASGNQTSTSQTIYQYTNRSAEQQIFKVYASVYASCGLNDWGFWRNTADDATSSTSNGVYMHPGYVKVGLTKVRSGLVTPPLSALLGKATLRISFKASPYGSSGPSDDLNMAVGAIDSWSESSKRVSGSEIAVKEIALKNQLGWDRYTVELSGVTPTSRLVFRGNAASVASKNNRFLIDDIKVEFVKYDSGVDTSAPVVRQVASSPTSVTVEWDDTTEGAYTVSLYEDSSCTSSVQSYSTTVSSKETYVKWPKRFTFPYLKHKSTYYVKVKNSAGRSSLAAAVTTSRTSSQTGVLLRQEFDNICWGGDYINQANSVNLSGVSSGTYSPSALSDAIKFSVSAADPAEDGPMAGSISAALRNLCDLQGWSCNYSYFHQGCIKVGSANTSGFLRTPAISSLFKDNAKIDVSFKACPFITDAAKENSPEITVSVLDGSGQTLSSKNVTIGSMRSEPGWGEFTASFTGFCNGYSVKFSTTASSQGAFLLDDIIVRSEDAMPENCACGHITYSDGTPAAGIVVSDGFNATKTDAKGSYMLSTSHDSWYIFYSLPEDCEVPINSMGQPCFYQRYTYGKNPYDFTLTKRTGGKEESFTLLCFADPQCKSTANITRMKNETLPTVKGQYLNRVNACYGVTLGDVVFSSGARNTNELMPNMRSALASTSIGIPVFQTMGNHDYTYFYGTSNPNFADETSSSPNLRAQRCFEECFGPINYSWNRSDTHIVCMRDIIYSSTTDASSYNGGFTDEQYEWLKQDLSYVPKTKMVILCVHIPIVGVTGNSNVMNVLNLMSQFVTPQVMSGHTHYMRNEQNIGGSKVFEHVHAAVCGAWWNSNLNGDGCPNGFGVYDITGNKIKDHYYLGSNTKMNTRDYQIRLYRGNMYSGGKNEYFQMQLSSNVLLANVFNGGPGWKVKVYENGTYTGDMTLIPNKKYSESNFVRDPSGTTKVPTDSSQDWWTIGYHLGVKNLSRSSYLTTCRHMYKYTLKNASASIKVVATDDLGNQYTCTEVQPQSCTTDTYPTYIVSGNH